MRVIEYMNGVVLLEIPLIAGSGNEVFDLFMVKSPLSPREYGPYRKFEDAKNKFDVEVAATSS